jgi:aminoglycoside phosphotransferase (APT) family kinase protein
MTEARSTIEQHYENPTFEGDEHETMDRILALFDIAESRWSEIEALCGLAPSALIHGDFAERNVRVRSETDGEALYAFDWEVSGWGPPSMDLALADVHLYWTLVRDHWCGLEYETLSRLAEVGKLLRGGIAATNWTALTLATEWPGKAIDDMRVYVRRMTAAMKAMGWAA